MEEVTQLVRHISEQYARQAAMHKIKAAVLAKLHDRTTKAYSFSTQSVLLAEFAQAPGHNLKESNIFSSLILNNYKLRKNNKLSKKYHIICE